MLCLSSDKGGTDYGVQTTPVNDDVRQRRCGSERIITLGKASHRRYSPFQSEGFPSACCGERLGRRNPRNRDYHRRRRLNSYGLLFASAPQTMSPLAKVQSISSVYFPQFEGSVHELDLASADYLNWIWSTDPRATNTTREWIMHTSMLRRATGSS